VRPKGNSSLSSVANDDTTDRYSLKIDFGQYVDGQTYHGIRKLALNNNISDATYMKEAISYDIYNFLGIPTPE
ncbi:CotH kinase family protein, partial [Escherichia coli]|uniref:CotH kinase family protein n=2 Tax=Bacteria TaxID=2 RepID=UPI0011E4AEBB